MQIKINTCISKLNACLLPFAFCTRCIMYTICKCHLYIDKIIDGGNVLIYVTQLNYLITVNVSRPPPYTHPHIKQESAFRLVKSVIRAAAVT